jgi:hypothetical protein
MAAPGFVASPQRPADRKRTAQMVRVVRLTNSVEPFHTVQRLPSVFCLPTATAQPCILPGSAYAALQPPGHRLPERAMHGPPAVTSAMVSPRETLCHRRTNHGGESMTDAGGIHRKPLCNFPGMVSQGSRTVSAINGEYAPPY